MLLQVKKNVKNVMYQLIKCNQSFYEKVLFVDKKQDFYNGIRTVTEIDLSHDSIARFFGKTMGRIYENINMNYRKI